MNAKSVVGVIIVAILIGVIYVVFEKNFFDGGTLNNSQASSARELPKDGGSSQSVKESSLIKYPDPSAPGAPVTESTDLLQEAQGLEMRDYSGLFEELKGTL